MAPPIERWARQAVALEARGDFTPVASRSVWDDLNDAQALQRAEWMTRQRALRDQPTALNGIYAGLENIPPATVQANVASVSGEVSLWNTVNHCALPANGLTAPTTRRLLAAWSTTTAATPGSLTINPRVGSFAAAASTTGGVPLGADTAITLTASITTLWICRADLTIRSIGAPGANSKIFGSFNVIAKPATAGVGAATINDIFGWTEGSFDASVASGVTLGMAHTVTTITHALQQAHWASWN